MGEFANEWLTGLITAQQLVILRQALENNINSPLSSSAGRLIDAMAGCLGLSAHRQSYEGQAAYPLSHNNTIIDPARLFRVWAQDLNDDVTRDTVAARFVAATACTEEPRNA